MYDDVVIIHFLPENTSPCGGIKVHYDLSEIETDLGIESIISFPSQKRVPQWMVKRNIGKILDYFHISEFAFYMKKKGKKVIIIGTENADILDYYFNDDFKKVCYIQGHSFWDPLNINYSNKTIVTVSDFVKNAIMIDNSFVLNPFIRNEIFYPSKTKEFFDKKDEFHIVIQGRKRGRAFLQKLVEILRKKSSSYSDILLDRLHFKVIGDVNELEFSKELRDADIFIAHSYPEGFGLPSLEAMASKTLVIGYTGGGGSEFLNENTGFPINDGDIDSLADTIYNVLFQFDRKKLEVLVLQAYNVARSYNKERTKEQFVKLLDGILNNGSSKF
jgi:glycosyltransferase involved in cell wall biosynthesis